MKSLSLFRSFAWFLSLILVLAPVNFAVSGDFISHADMQHESEMSGDLIVKSNDSSHHMHEMSTATTTAEHHSDENPTNQSDDCKSECANCVYCSAGNITSSDATLTLYTSSNPEVTKYFLKSINHSVDIRPPISL